MIQPGENKAFDMVEARTLYLIRYRMAEWADLITAGVYSDDPDVESVYRLYIDNAANDIKKMVNWCYDRGFMDLSEASRIIHWLVWFGFPTLE